ncbi:aminotransferase class III-fold pyridoxal phosphate-dependent enzyme [Komagataeibacter medellinensis]|uniref:aminotransferase class III-fold pyridoxal phosphate-dependent enzyme n=1 Tax=Komagataeibacter medellinensis TaxID=1177712 RepID=UPI00225E6BF9|nr:aminotransferase class III-fold pyridoxal phosphate-dependent enzyme [Komagataeibacter medellinensis]
MVTACHGYNHPHIRRRCRRSWHACRMSMFGGLVNEPALTLATRLAALLPGDLERVFFTDSGSVAVEVAMKNGNPVLAEPWGAGTHRLLAFPGRLSWGYDGHHGRMRS